MYYDHATIIQVISSKFKGRLTVHTKSDYVTETDECLSEYNGLRWYKAKIKLKQLGYNIKVIGVDVNGKLSMY